MTGSPIIGQSPISDIMQYIVVLGHSRGSNNTSHGTHLLWLWAAAMGKQWFYDLIVLLISLRLGELKISLSNPNKQVIVGPISPLLCCVFYSDSSDLILLLHPASRGFRKRRPQFRISQNCCSSCKTEITDQRSTNRIFPRRPSQIFFVMD